MAYNLTLVTDNSTSMLGLFQSVNTNILYDSFGIVILLAISVIIFLSYLKATEDVSKAVMATSWVSVIACILLMAINLIANIKVLIITVVIAAISLAFTWGK